MWSSCCCVQWRRLLHEPFSSARRPRLTEGLGFRAAGGDAGISPRSSHAAAARGKGLGSRAHCQSTHIDVLPHVAGTANGGITHSASTGPQKGARGRCRVVVMLQRLVARVHEAHGPAMPPPLALQLVGVLQVG